VKNEVMLIVIFAAAIFIFLCVAGIIKGTASNGIRNVMFGVFGLLAYVVPIIIFLGFAFGISNKGNTVAVVKMVSGVILVFLVGILAFLFKKQEHLLTGNSLVSELYQTSAEQHAGGGVLFGSIAHALYTLIGFGGTLFVVIVLSIICVVFITEKSFLSSVKKGGSYLLESAREDAARMREYRESLREEYEEAFDEEEFDEEPVEKQKHTKRQKRVHEEYIEEPKEKVRRMDKKARGVASSSAISLKSRQPKDTARQDIHEIVLLDEQGNMDSDAVCEDISARPFNAVHYQEDAAAFEAGSDSGMTEFGMFESGVQEGAYDSEMQGLEIQDSDLYDSGAYGFETQDTASYGSEMQSYEAYDDEMQNAAANDFEPYDSEINELNVSESDAFSDFQGVSVKASFMDALDEDALSSMPEPVTEDTVLEKPDYLMEDSQPETQDYFMEDGSIEKPEYLMENSPIEKQELKQETQAGAEQITVAEEAPPKEYIFPSLNLLKKGEGRKGDTSNQLKETALRLQQTLQNFGVKVIITDISQGPSVTRYEMQPEQGVKVSKIVSLADDIKLNLAATDIRIEAPIPGKAAVGIEVPNKENSTVALRDLLESEEFQKFPSNLAFAVGKDIGGQVVVTDIAKMPHVLIAGATGSGKSVCINTIIMSILYKANPADVKLIMIDPKVVELSVYNGIPHLMIPVVTDPKKASAALNWGVAEMNDRYNKFANLNVRDLKGYNKAAEMGKLSEDGEPLQKLPQIVIIVDELADLMMVASGEVEESICRLAQLARACGIHLVIATQRPSVDVITGLIKANMPSRIAFSVSSGTDSRTILDMNGAEKLLGKGDMLFYPQGYTKPARVQGAFVSDSEVEEVVSFLRNQMIGNTYSNDIANKIETMQSSAGAASGNSGSDVDTYFAEAGKFVIEKDKASIGMLQRVFKIGFNRAARIVDQLEEAGVVGAEEGTKPRRILMSMEQFQNYLEENA